MVRDALDSFQTISVPTNGGNQVLGALAIVETSKRYDGIVPVTDPVVASAVRKIKKDLATGRLQKHSSVYYPSLAIILLCDVGDRKYQAEINTLIESLVDRQQASGAFTYVHLDGLGNGDTSQTQYGSLALWVAYRHGFQVPKEVPRKALEWLMSVNLPSGGWAYQYTNGNKSTPGPLTLPIHTAAIGTVYLLSDFLQLNRNSSGKAAKNKQAIEEQVAFGTGFPPSVSVYVPPKEGSQFGSSSRLVKLDVGRLNSVKRSGNQYLGKNFEIELNRWGYYFLYALERYAFFREKAEGRVPEIPNWYDMGVELLKAKQKDDGSFHSRSGENGFQATCFAVLFLVRSSEILIPPSAEGALNGGKGLRSNVRLDLVDGKVKSFDVVRGIEDVLQLLDSSDIDEQQFELIQDSLGKAISQLSTNTSRTQREQLVYMRGLVSDRNYFKRLIAIKLLSRQQNMNNVPALIYALGDPDLRICAEAHNGLRLISRKLDSISVTDSPDHFEYQSVKREWTEWFLKIRPGAELLD